jgi:signal transduction histidine kinase
MNMHTAHTILLITQNTGFCAAFRAGLEREGGDLRVLFASSVNDARRLAWDHDPALIVLEESGLSSARESASGEFPPSFEAEVALLAGIAPVVVVAAAERQGEIPALMAAGAADFVASAGDFVPCVIGMACRRLQRREQESAGTLPAPPAAGAGEDFGELLRHELNNPLTGILGNAELLLVEVRREKDGRLPHGAQERLQTIADLAVRLRETVRRLSQQWVEKHANARSSI